MTSTAAVPTAVRRPSRVLRVAALHLANPSTIVTAPLLILAAIFAPLLATHDPYLPQLGKRLAAPGGEFWFGADELGRDMISRLMLGSRLSLFLGVTPVLIAFVLQRSLVAGLTAGGVKG